MLFPTTFPRFALQRPNPSDYAEHGNYIGKLFCAISLGYLRLYDFMCLFVALARILHIFLSRSDASYVAIPVPCDQLAG